MKRVFFSCSLLFVFLLILSSCGREQVYYHNKNGKVKHRGAARNPVWYDVTGKKYSKRTRRILRQWD